MKADCYKCEYRGTVLGSCHSSCKHPAIVGKDGNEFGALVQLLRGEFNEAIDHLKIKAHAHGVRSGWFMWPANFDPVWLENCDGFKVKEEAKD